MGTPFNASNTARTAVTIPATDAQLKFISTLLSERKWQFGATKHVERTTVISLVLGWAMGELAVPENAALRETLTDDRPLGEVVNRVLGYLNDKNEDDDKNFQTVPLTKQGASKLIDWLGSNEFASATNNVEERNISAAKRSVIEQRSTGVPSADVVPAGRYAIETEDGAVNELAFYKVDRPTEGRWAGRVFVKLMQSDDEQRLSWATSKSVLAKIAAVGAEAASARYGHEIGECGICGRTLTNDESRARGIGPKCAAKAGW